MQLYSFLSEAKGSNIYFLYFHHNPYKYVVTKIPDISHKIKERKLAFFPSDVNCQVGAKICRVTLHKEHKITGF